MLTPPWASYSDSRDGLEYPVLVTYLEFKATNSSGTGSTWLSVSHGTGTPNLIDFPRVTGNAHRFGTSVVSASAGGCVGTMNSGGSVAAAQMQNSSATIPAVYIGTGQTGSAAFVHLFEGADPDQVLGSITSNGTDAAFNTSSDAKLKSNIRESGSAVELVMSIPVNAFEWLKNGKHTPFGYVAQSLYEYFPEAVTIGDIWQVAPSAMIPVLHRGLQEEIARGRTLEQLVQQLLARVAALEGGSVGVIGK